MDILVVMVIHHNILEVVVVMNRMEMMNLNKHLVVVHMALEVIDVA